MIESVMQQPYAVFLISLALGVTASLVGGAASGYVIAGRDLGTELATQIGGLFGALSGLPGIALALLVIFLIG